MTNQELGALLKKHGDPAAAQAAYQRAIDSGHPRHAPEAMNNLGNLLRENGDTAGARAAYLRAIDSGHPRAAAAAARSLNALDRHGLRNQLLRWLAPARRKP
jgi:tetratricopeptide (TPR) repeat protein